MSLFTRHPKVTIWDIPKKTSTYPLVYKLLNNKIQITLYMVVINYNSLKPDLLF